MSDIVLANAVVYDSSGNLVPTPVVTISQSAGISALTGYVTASGTGSVVATVVKTQGTTTNDSATAGDVGQYIASVATLGQLTAGAYSDVTTLALTAGDWDVSMTCQLDNLDTVMSAYVVGVSVTSGDTGTGLVTSVSKVQGGAVAAKTPVSIPNIRFSLAAPATLYLKCYVDTTGGTGAQCVGGLTARRRR